MTLPDLKVMTGSGESTKNGSRRNHFFHKAAKQDRNSQGFLNLSLVVRLVHLVAHRIGSLLIKARPLIWKVEPTVFTTVPSLSKVEHG